MIEMSHMREALLASDPDSPRAQHAELSVILRLSGKVSRDTTVIHAPPSVLHRFRRLARERYRIDGKPDGRTLTYRGQTLVRLAGLVRGGRLVQGLDPCVVALPPDTALWAVRGAILARGSLVRTQGKYALGLSTPTLEAGMGLSGLLRKCGVASTRNNDLLTLVPNSQGLIDFMSRIPRVSEIWKAVPLYPVRPQNNGTVMNNRLKAARQGRVAALRAQQALDLLGERVPEHLMEAAHARIENPTISLVELGELMIPPLSKDAISGRLRRLFDLATREAA